MLGAPISLASSPDGRFLYVGGEAGNGSARLQVFGPKGSGGFQRIECLTGDSLDATCTYEPKLLDAPTDMEVSADGKNLYIGTHNGFLLAFARTTSGPNEGHVAPLPGRRACTTGANDATVQNGTCTSVRRMITGNLSSWVKISPDQQFVYAGGQGLNGTMSIFQRDPTDGSLHQNVTSNADPRWCVSDGGPVTAWNEDGSPSPDGKGGNEGACTVAVDPTDPNATFAEDYSLDFNAAGTLAYATEPYFGEVFEFARVPGQPQLTTIHTTTTGFDSPTDVVVSRSTGDVYVSYNSPNAPGSAVVAAFTPTLNLINCIAESSIRGCAKGFGLTGANALALSPDESRLYVAGQLDSSIAELTIGPNGGLSQPGSNGKNDCAATGGAENCIPVGALGQGVGVAPWDLTDALITGPSCSGAALYNAATDDSALHSFSVSGGTRSASSLTLAPASATNPVGTKHTVTATLTDGCGPVSGKTVRFTVTGANPTSGTGTTGSTGKATFTYTGTHAGQDTIVACYDANGNGTCGDNGDATSNAATKTWTANADLSITKTDSPDPVAVGQTLTYKLTAKNNGPSNATGVKVTDNLPSTVTFQSATPSQGSCSQSAGTVTCNLGNLGSGASATVEIKVTPTSPGKITNNASVGGNEPDANSSNNRASAQTTVNPSADLSITKTGSPDPIVVGQTLTYKLTAKNNGPSNATGVKVTDNLPSTVTFQSATPSQGSCSQSAGTVTCNLGSLGSGASATVEIKVTPRSAGKVTNTVTVGGNEFDANASNNHASAQTTVNPSADLSITKTGSPDPVAVGQTLTYKLTAKNNGPSNATGVKVTDNLPSSVTFQSSTPSQGTCSQSAGTVTCNLGSLGSGASATVEIKVTPKSAGKITNTATVGGNEFDANTSNNHASAQTTVNGCGTGTNEPDRNGDLHSHCHTGSKGRGAGGNDKASRKT